MQPAHRVQPAQHVDLKTEHHQRQRAEAAEETPLAPQRIAQQARRQQQRQRYGEGAVAQRRWPRAEQAGQPERQARQQPEQHERQTDAPAEGRSGGELRHRGEYEAGHGGEAKTEQQFVGVPYQRPARTPPAAPVPRPRKPSQRATASTASSTVSKNSGRKLHSSSGQPSRREEEVSIVSAPSQPGE